MRRRKTAAEDENRDEDGRRCRCEGVMEVSFAGDKLKALNKR